MASIFKRKRKVNGKVVEAKRFTIQFSDPATGKTRRAKGFTDRRESSKLGQALESGAAVPNHRKTPLTEHLAAFVLHLRAVNNAPKYVTITETRINRILTGCEFQTLPHITLPALENWLAAERKKGSFGIATSNEYGSAFKSFLTWCVANRLADTNPVQHFSKLNDTDPPRERRAIGADEFGRLIVSTLTAPNYRRLTGEDRAMLYLVAAYSGLRASELSSLTPESFDLDNGCIVVAAAHSKRRRIDRQPVRADLIELLRGWLPGRSGRLWAGSWSNNAAEMIREDLEAAGVAYVDDAGKVADFHALRHTYISSLAMANVPVKVAQVLARHSTVTLTMDVYSHSETRHETAALATLPAMPKWSQPKLTHDSTHRQPITRHDLALPGTRPTRNSDRDSSGLQPRNGYFLHSTPVCYGSGKTHDGRFPTCPQRLSVIL